MNDDFGDLDNFDLDEPISGRNKKKPVKPSNDFDDLDDIDFGDGGGNQKKKDTSKKVDEFDFDFWC